MNSPTKKKKKNINSVSKFLKFIENNNIIQDNSTNKIYFRGNSEKDKEDVPSIYRKPNLIKNEHNIYHEMISRIPQEFIDCKTAFDHLVKMQHYGLPTRLLDITRDPLVALFFACSSHEDKDGKITIYNIPATDVKTYDSDTVAMLANLAKVKELNLKIIKMLHLMYSYNLIDHKMISNILPIPCGDTIDIAITNTDLPLLFVNFLRSYAEDKPNPQKVKIKKIIRTINNSLIIEPEALQETFKQVANMNSKETTLVNQLISPFRRFIHCIKAEKSYFDSTQMNLEHISSVQFVEPKKDNPRIIKQNGAFLIFGLANNSNSKEATPKIPSNFYFKNKDNNIIEIIIPKEAKPNILKQLKMLSISESTLFPEADKIASEIKNKYLIDGN